MGRQDQGGSPSPSLPLRRVRELLPYVQRSGWSDHNGRRRVVQAPSPITSTTLGVGLTLSAGGRRACRRRPAVRRFETKVWQLRGRNSSTEFAKRKRFSLPARAFQCRVCNGGRPLESCLLCFWVCPQVSEFRGRGFLGFVGGEMICHHLPRTGQSGGGQGVRFTKQTQSCLFERHRLSLRPCNSQ